MCVCLCVRSRHNHCNWAHQTIAFGREQFAELELTGVQRIHETTRSLAASASCAIAAAAAGVVDSNVVVVVVTVDCGRSGFGI